MAIGSRFYASCRQASIELHCSDLFSSVLTVATESRVSKFLSHAAWWTLPLVGWSIVAAMGLAAVATFAQLNILIISWGSRMQGFRVKFRVCMWTTLFCKFGSMTPREKVVRPLWMLPLVLIVPLWIGSKWAKQSWFSWSKLIWTKMIVRKCL